MSRSNGAGGPPRTKHVVPTWLPARGYEWLFPLSRHGPVPLLDPVPGASQREGLHIATIVPSMGRGGGGHYIIFQLLSRLEQRGHTCSVWYEDFYGLHQGVKPAVIRGQIREFYAPLSGPVFTSYDDWFGADVVVSTGWQTVYPSLLLEDARARAYLVNDHEPEFYETSFDSYYAERTYGYGLFCICGSPWLRDLVAERYGAEATDFEFGVDHDVYRPRPIERRRDTVIFYARAFTPRRAVGMGLYALQELRRRMPEVRIVMFGDEQPWHTYFDYEHIGVVSPEQLSWAFSEATVGLSLSLTNFSLTPKEMLACGLPCVEVAGISAESIFGDDGPVDLAEFNPVAIADALERLLTDRDYWEKRSTAGRAYVADKTWDAATDQVEAGLRTALREREAAWTGTRLS